MAEDLSERVNIKIDMKIQLLVRQYTRMIGIARYVTGLQASLSQMGVDYTCVEPSYPFPVRLGDRLLRPLGYDVNTFFTNYPVAAKLDKHAVKHLTSQMMGSLLAFKPGMKKVAITVHDIVPYLVRNDPNQSTFRHPFDRFFDQLAMKNLREADLLMVDSAYTGELLVNHLLIARDQIRVVQLGLDHKRFQVKKPPTAFMNRYNLHSNNKYLMFVGSENPRKNLPFLIEALHQLQQRIPSVKLLKVGDPENELQRKEFLRQITSLHMNDQVIFIEQIPEDDLTALYNSVDCFVFPSLYEGFGFPPLEAMACGAPVVCSTAASLPEVVGHAALLVDPNDMQGWVDAMERILLDDQLRRDLRERGIERAADFTWERTARQTLSVYEELM